MKITKEMIMTNMKHVLSIIILVSVATASFKLGSMYQASKPDPKTEHVENPYAHAFSPEEISIAVNESNELIMIERKTGKYIVYSDFQSESTRIQPTIRKE